MTLADVLTDVGLVTTFVLDLVGDMLQLFLEPPLIIFIGLGIATVVFMLVKGLIWR